MVQQNCLLRQKLKQNIDSFSLQIQKNIARCFEVKIVVKFFIRKVSIET